MNQTEPNNFCVIVMISSVIYDLMFRFTRDGRDSHSFVKDPVSP